MSFFKRLLGRDKPAPRRIIGEPSFADHVNPMHEPTGYPSAMRLAAGVDMRYDSGLVEALLLEHRELVEQLQAFGTAYKNGQSLLLDSLMAEFKKQLQSHLAIKTIKIYGHLQNIAAHSEATAAEATLLRREMRKVGLDVIAFLERYDTRRGAANNDPRFLTELERVSVMLLKRFDLEETIVFPQYQRAQGKR